MTGKKVLLIDADLQGCGCPVGTSAVGRSTDRAGRRDSLSISLGIKRPDELDVSLATLMSKVIDNKPFDDDYPVKYKDVNGKIRDKSNKISRNSGGDYTNAENDINTYFPKKLNRNKGIELKFGEYVVEMAPNIKGNSDASRQTGHNKYFDSTGYVQYPNVFDENISLRYTLTFEGYKEDIVLSKYAGINEFSFRLYTDGLSLVMNEDGTYYLIDPLSGEVKTQIRDLVVYDSKPFDVPEEILNESVSNPTEEEFAKKEATLKELIESVPIDKTQQMSCLIPPKIISISIRLKL